MSIEKDVDQAQTQVDFIEEGTRVDLGEDLIEAHEAQQAVKPNQKTSESISTSEEAQSVYHSAEILFNEGLLEDSKKLLRKVLIFDRYHPQAKSKLKQIHEVELEKLLKTDSSVKKITQTVTVDADLIEESLAQYLDLENSITNAATDSHWTVDEIYTFTEEMQKKYSDLNVSQKLDIGVAYLEMGFYEVALSWLSLIEKNLRDTEDKISTVFLSCIFLKSVVLFRKQDYHEAVNFIENYLFSADLIEQDKIHLLYLVAISYTRLKKKASAYDALRKISKIDENYRDVRELLKK